MDWLTRHLDSWGLTWWQVLAGVLISVITFVASIAVVTFVLVKLPPNYFHSSHERDFLVDRHRALRWTGIIAKNLFGLVLVFFGVVMSLPGVPGQGVLTILLGIMLLDFPGKRNLETKLVGRPKVFRMINRLREKFGKPPLFLD
ncbi:MAG: hypothetical protein LC802_16405 [Acidobacteria bacterium]|nr:hypothetical protein [Acidobacteriota bacterium]